MRGSSSDPNSLHERVFSVGSVDSSDPELVEGERARDKLLMDLNEISSEIIKAAITVHKELGPGLLESVYQACMVIELQHIAMNFQSQLLLPIFYRGQKLNGLEFRLDLLVEDEVVVELKSVARVEEVHKKQLLTYLRLADKRLGLLINFNESLLKDGITRIINTRQS